MNELITALNQAARLLMIWQQTGDISGADPLINDLLNKARELIRK